MRRERPLDDPRAFEIANRLRKEMGLGLESEDWQIVGEDRELRAWVWRSVAVELVRLHHPNYRRSGRKYSYQEDMDLYANVIGYMGKLRVSRKEAVRIYYRLHLDDPKNKKTKKEKEKEILALDRRIARTMKKYPVESP